MESFNTFRNKKYEEKYLKNCQDIISGKDDARIIELSKKDTHYNAYVKTIFKTNESYTDYVLKGIHNGNESLIKEYIKPPQKQNFDEDLQIEYIKENIKDTIFNIEQFKKTAKTTPFISEDGKIIYNRIKNLKTIDSVITFSKNNEMYKVYIIQKYLNARGGGQRNQCDDLIKQLEYGSKNNDKNTFFIGLLDSPYKIWFKRLRQQNFDNTKVFTINSDGILDILNKIYKNA